MTAVAGAHRFFRAEWPALVARGPDAASWLGGIVTGDVPASGEAESRWSLLLSKQGKILAELCVLGGEELTLLIVGGDAEKVRHLLDHHLVMEDVELSLVNRREVIVYFPSDDPDAARRELTQLGFRTFTLPMAAGGALLLVSSEAAAGDSLRASGARELSKEEFGALRVGLGWPTFGVDFSEADNPHEASLERRAVSWQKGCYLGQEVVFMQDARGKVKRRLVRIEPASGEEPDWQVGSALSAAGADVGVVTSLGHGVGIARVTAPHFEPGTVLSIAGQSVLVRPLAG